MNQQTIFDNSPAREVLQVIKDRLPQAIEGKFAVGYFFLSGFRLVEDDFPGEPGGVLKIIMGRETTQATGEQLILGQELREQTRQDLLLDLYDLPAAQKENIARLAELIAKGRIEIRLFETGRLHAKLYLFLSRPDEKFESRGLALVGSSNFTAAGLQTNKELNVLLTDKTQIDYLNDWYETLWDDAVEFKKDLLKIIDIANLGEQKTGYPRLGEQMTPERLFRYLVYRWFDGRVLRLSQKDVLAEYQLIGVLNATRMLESYNGAIVADSVGLGKSFIGMAIVEDYITGVLPEWHSDKSKTRQALLLLPPSVINQWEEILVGDPDREVRKNYLAGDVIASRSYFFTGNKLRLLPGAKPVDKTIEMLDENSKPLGRIRLYSLGLFQHPSAEQKSEQMADDHDLILVDEAHKYRNANSRRWERLRNMRVKSDGQTPNRMLLLTATPINNSVYDLYNLIRLFCDDAFLAFRNTAKGDIAALFNDYARIFREARAEKDKGQVAALRKKAVEIQEKVIDEVVLLRTRKHIRDRFPDIEIDGRKLIFKDPQPFPINYADFAAPAVREFVGTLAKVLPELEFEHTKLYGARFVGFSEQTFVQEAKQKRVYVVLGDILRLLLGKRLESGLYAFEITLRRIYVKEKSFYQKFIIELDAIQTEEQLRTHLETCLLEIGIDKSNVASSEEWAEADGVEIDGEADSGWFDNVKRVLRDYDGENLGRALVRTRERLAADVGVMKDVLDRLDRLKTGSEAPEQGRVIFDYINDPKLEALKSLLGPPELMSASLGDAPNLHGRKVLLFTQYKDTAYYLAFHLRRWAENDAVMHAVYFAPAGFKNSSKERSRIGLVTGDTDASARSVIKRRFAPQANRGGEEVEFSGELQLLIATDAFSEGVNLQDADAVVNYDLPWNPMILVQRTGRINRIGNEKDVIVANYFPELEVQALVGVLRKLQEKISDITLLLGKESKILEPGEKIDERTFGEKIRAFAETNVTELEQQSLPAELRDMKSEKEKMHADEFRLLQAIQFERGYRAADFEEFVGCEHEKRPRFCFVRGLDRLYSVYELKRGGKWAEKTIERRVFSVALEDLAGVGAGEIPGERIREESPLALLKLLDGTAKKSNRILDIAEALKTLGDGNQSREQELQSESATMQKGFLNNLANQLKIVYRDRWKNDPLKKELFIRVYNPLQALSPQKYTSELKPLLRAESLIEEHGNDLRLSNEDRTLEVLGEYFQKRKIGGVNYSSETIHYGWFYEG